MMVVVEPREVRVGMRVVVVIAARVRMWPVRVLVRGWRGTGCGAGSTRAGLSAV